VRLGEQYLDALESEGRAAGAGTSPAVLFLHDARGAAAATRSRVAKLIRSRREHVSAMCRISVESFSAVCR
jgi:hypothetical protein